MPTFPKNNCIYKSMAFKKMYGWRTRFINHKHRNCKIGNGIIDIMKV